MLCIFYCKLASIYCVCAQRSQGQTNIEKKGLLLILSYSLSSSLFKVYLQSTQRDIWIWFIRKWLPCTSHHCLTPPLQLLWKHDIRGSTFASEWTKSPGEPVELRPIRGCGRRRGANHMDCSGKYKLARCNFCFPFDWWL